MLLGVACAGAEKLKCQGEGRFPNPNLCGAYYDCTPNNAGGYDMVKDDCRGFAYNSGARHCSEKLCETRIKRSVTSDNHPYSRMCEGLSDGFLCANCKTVVVCVKGQAFIRHCIDNFFCSELAQFGGGVCYPDHPTECKCVSPNDFRVDPYDPQRFFSCRDVGSKPTQYRCPEGMVFDETARECSANDLPPCSTSGTFAKSSNCSEYYTCIAVKNGWLQKHYICGAGTAYNAVTGTCENPCVLLECQNEGRFADPLSKHNYFECYMLGGKLKQLRYTCPETYRWEVLSPGVGKCVEEHGEDLTVRPYGECTMPKDLC
ncbi:uncharacterized protein [Penaeus vannamei]